MALSFKSVTVQLGGSSASDAALGTGLARWGFGVKIHAVDVALKSFHIGYSESDHNFFFQRIAIHNISVQNGDVHFDVFMKIRDDTHDPNHFTGEIEALVIADVDFP